MENIIKTQNGYRATIDGVELFIPIIQRVLETSLQPPRFTPFVYWNRVSSTSVGTAAIFRDGGNTVGSITYTNTATAYNTSSDYRLKENVAPMQNALDKIAQLNPVTYTWKADGSAGQGFIAHELQAVVPDCVTGEKDAVDADGTPLYQGVDTSFLVATLVKAIQELKAEVNSLRAQLNT